MEKTGNIYRLFCDDVNFDKFYVGSTSSEVRQRFATHKHNYKQNKYLCSSKILFDHGNVKFEILETIKYTDKKDLILREAYYIKKYKDEGLAIVNECIPTGKFTGMSQSERNKNRDKTSIRCECGGNYKYPTKSNHYKSKKHINYVNQNI